MKQLISRFSLLLDKIAGAVTSVCMTGLCVIIVYSVFMRFVMNDPVDWQYELTLVGLCWSVFMGMPMTFRKEEHLRLTFVTNSLKPKVWHIYMTVIDILLIAFLAAGFVCSLSIIETTWDTYYKTIPIRKGLYYLCFPIGCGFSIVQLIDIILNRKTADAPTAKKEQEV